MREAFPDELDETTDEAKDHCQLCGESGAEVLEHDGPTKCRCLVHPTCLEAWRAARDAKSARVLTCPACRGRLVGVHQPPPRKRGNVCNTVLPNDVTCVLPLGHLGHCAARLS